MRVCIDPGHGGSDPGTVFEEYIEKDLTLALSLKLKNILINNGVDTVLTRDHDITLSDDERVQIVKDSVADICLSIHFNSSNGKGEGSEVIFQMNNISSQDLADSILLELERTGLKKRKIFSRESTKNPGQDYYFMLRLTRPITTVIVESLFIDNMNDIAFLQKEDSLDLLAKAISNGAASYLGIMLRNSEHWAKEHLDNIKKLGIIEEYHDPEEMVTWGELATVIDRVINKLQNK